MSDYKPGDVATATVGGKRVRVFRVDNSSFPWTVAGDTDYADREVTDVRPLVVLDLGAANDLITADEVAEHAIKTLRRSPYISDGALADQIEAQTRPAIEEPGLWGVVATGYDDGSSVDYWTHGPGGWFNERGDLVEWGSIKSPTLIRKGANDE